MKTKHLILSVIALSNLTFLSGFILSSSRVSADDSVIDEVNIIVPVSCSLSGVGMTSHNTSINNGTYASDIGTTTLKASCNDLNGFAIYAAGYTGDEVGGTDSTKLVGENDIGNILTGTGTSGNSQWAMKLTTDSEATYPITIESDTNGSFASYHIVPEDFVKVASRNSSTDIGSASIGAVLTTTYQVYISATQPAGTYSGKVIYALVHPANRAAPVICNENATTISEVKCMQDFAAVSSANRRAIIASMTPETQYTLKDKRDGKSYTVAKYLNGEEDWTEYDLADNYVFSCEQGSCDSSIYNQLSSDWKAFVDSCNGSFDNWDETIAESLMPPAYDVWMTKNLDLDLQAGVTYTNEDTDIGYNAYDGQYETAAWSPSSSTHLTGNWVGLNSTPESYDVGDYYWNGILLQDASPSAQYHNSCITQCDYSLHPLLSSTGIPQYHLGNYYNWTAAVAMNDSSDYTTNGTFVDQSICPAGWTLPMTEGGYGSFSSLWSSYGFSSSSINGTDKIWASPLYFVVGSGFDGEETETVNSTTNMSLSAIGYEQYYWSSAVQDANRAKVAAFWTEGSIYVNSDNDRHDGDSVRCVARQYY